VNQIEKDFEGIRNALFDRLAECPPVLTDGTRRLLETLDRIERNYGKYSRACGRVAELADAISGHSDPIRLEHAYKIRQQLGDVYTQGSLL
jgi:hypothetical protein